MKFIYKISIICLIIVSLIILFIQNVDAQQEINETIQISEYYKHGFELENNAIIILNLTTDHYANFFFLSETALIDYEINGIAKPVHENWYKINTTKFFENITVDTSGTYFLIVESKNTPARELNNKTLFNIKGLFDIQKPTVKSISQPRLFLGIVLIIISGIALLIFSYIYALHIKMNNLASIAFIFICLLILGFIISNISFFKGDFNQAFSLLNTLFQTLAAILAIIVSINFVIAQILAQSYNNSAIIKSFIRNGLFTQIVLPYLLIIVLILFYMADIEKFDTYYGIYGIILYRAVDMIIYLFIFAIALVIPYIYGVAEQMKPEVIIKQLSKEVTTRNLLESSSIRKNFNTDLILKRSENGQGYIHDILKKLIDHFNKIFHTKSNKLDNTTTNKKFESDGLQPLREIANKAIKDSNFEVLRIISNKLENLGKEYVSDSTLTTQQKAIIAEHFGYHLYEIAKTSNEPVIMNLFFNALLEINMSSREDSVAKETIIYMGKIGRLYASYRLTFNAYDLIDKLSDRCIIFVDNNCSISAKQSLNDIYVISEELIKNNLLISRSRPIMASLYRIAKKTIEKQMDELTCDVLNKSQKIAELIVDYRKDLFVIPGALLPFFEIIKEVSTNMTDDMDILKGIMPSVVEQAGKLGENTQDTELVKRLASTLIIVGINLNKRNIGKAEMFKTLVILINKNPFLIDIWDDIVKPYLDPGNKEFLASLKSEILRKQKNKTKSRGA